MNSRGASSSSRNCSPPLVGEQPLDPLLAGELGDDRAQPPASREQSERDRYGRLADASLAGHEQQAFVEQRGHRTENSGAGGLAALDRGGFRSAATNTAVDMSKVIAFANQKGGVAKTTTTLNLAVAFAE